MANNPNPTTNHNLPKPAKGDLDGTWGDTVNEELTQRLEERLVARDTEANLSNYTPYDEAIFIATDTGAVYDGDGSSWNKADRDFETVEATNTLTDPSGTDHTGELADSSDLHSRYTDEEAEDAVAAILGGGDKISISYDDPNDNLTVDTSALDTEEVEDAVSSLVTSDSNLSWTYDDQNDTLTISLADSISVSSLEADEVDVGSGNFVKNGSVIPLLTNHVDGATSSDTFSDLEPAEDTLIDIQAIDAFAPSADLVTFFAGQVSNNGNQIDVRLIDAKSPAKFDTEFIDVSGRTQGFSDSFSTTNKDIAATIQIRNVDNTTTVGLKRCTFGIGIKL